MAGRLGRRDPVGELHEQALQSRLRRFPAHEPTPLREVRRLKRGRSIDVGVASCFIPNILHWAARWTLPEAPPIVRPSQPLPEPESPSRTRAEFPEIDL